MKIDKQDNNLIVFLNKKMTEKIDFTNKINLEKYFQKLFIRLNNIYELDMHGSYEITIYNNSYGVILEIKEQDIEYFDYYNEIDMNLNISKNNEIIYKLTGEIPNNKNYNIYMYNGDIYIKPTKMDFITLGILIENSEIIYGKNASKILNQATKVNNKITLIV